MFDYIKKPIVKITLKDGNCIKIQMPTKELYDRIVNTTDYIDICNELLPENDFTEDEKLYIYINYVKIVVQAVKTLSEEIPYYPNNEMTNVKYTVQTGTEKLVSNYTGLNFFEIGSLNICDYWAFVKDAIIYNNLSTESGREYLENCWNFAQTEPDRPKLRELKKKLERSE